MAKGVTDIDLAEVQVDSDPKVDSDMKGTEGSGPRKRSPILFVLIALVLLMVAGGGGFFAYSKLFASAAEDIKPKPEKAVKAEKPGKEVAVGPMIAFSPFVVNLADSGGKRYMKLNIEAELSGKELNEEIDKRLPQIRDTIILLLSSKSFNEIQDIGGKNRLRDELIVRVNGLLKTGKVKNVYFTEFVVQ